MTEETTEVLRAILQVLNTPLEDRLIVSSLIVFIDSMLEDEDD